MSTCYNLCWLKLVDLAKYKYLIGQTRRLFLKLALFLKKSRQSLFFKFNFFLKIVTVIKSYMNDA